MNGIAVLLSLATIGVDFGWRPGTDGRMEYIIQLRPTEADSLLAEGIVSDIPPEVRDVRRIRVQVGTASLPRGGGAGGEAGTAWQLNGSDLAPAGRVGLNAAGVLDLPPPPPLLGPDGKTSVLVRPGERALPGLSPPANGVGAPPASTPSFDLGNPGTPGVTAPGGFSGGLGTGGVGAPAGGFAPSGIPGSGFTDPPNWGNSSPGNFSVPVQPVPGSGPETGFPPPIRGASDKSKNQSLIDKLVGISKDPTGKHTDDATDLIDDVAAAASQKPALEDEVAENLKERPWATLVWTSLALFGSLAANAYLGWVAVGIYGRYRDMCDQLHDAQASLT